MSTDIHLGRDGSVAELVLDGPKTRNAVGESALALLRTRVEQVHALADAGDVRAVVFRGEGTVFCSGRDIAGVDPQADDAIRYLDGELTPTVQALRGLNVPTIAAVQGAALGVGFGLAAACDVVYAGQNAKFGSPFLHLGAAPDSGAHAYFVDRLGIHRTLDLIYTGEFLTGADAAAAGLVSRALPDDEVLDVVRAAATKMANGPTLAFAASKRIAQSYFDSRQSLIELMSIEASAQEGLRTTADYAEGFGAFADKRAPKFTGH
ncbi:enoyl-CoA hydratase/isomerase family protein [Spelaeicoccus albus]|uniref:Enoyl-CoA hydratase/carnithine racemase n=1 Tax=Spelaeicoccus albus TaxID=1280376 RepID=A0A7Z0IH46_9MICO|nr:enoyl-CoA hydratase-related protein [Spelaeicoccus albus]NYI67533.1 enoyl-CoA hydratase/carnithine racemase [Spelaeicoccus albus]